MMRKSIRNKLAALIFLISMSLIGIIWVMTVFMFKPMYYATTQSDLTRTAEKVVAAIDAEGGVTNATLEQISGFVNVGICVEIADAEGNGIVLFEGIGDACQIHSGDIKYDHFSQQRKIDSAQAMALRQAVRHDARGNYNMHLQDELGNRQAVKGRFYAEEYTVIVSTNLSRTDSIVSIVSSQLRTASLIAIVLSLIVATIMSTWFMGPLMKMSSAVKQIAKGNYNVKLEVESSDEIGRLANEFNHMAEEIQHSQNMQKELLASISHDLRTPLTIIKGYAESIKDITGDNKEIRDQQLATIIDETDRLSAMVGSVMEYTKLSQGVQKMNIVQFDIADMCKDIVYVYSQKAEAENKSIAYSGPEDAYVFADAQMMERAIHNFVSNALLHTPENTRVVVAVNVQDSGKVKISVFDSGTGIRPEDIPHLFDKYYRARKDEGRTGSGLGLAIVKSIMENHNFRYGVESREGLGTEFWFEI